MTQAQHTQGPWEVKPFGFREGDICTVDGQTFLFQRLNKATDADARLIAAAPDLLAALEVMVAHYPHWAAGMEMKQIDRDAIAMARAAIAKAKGA